MTGATRLALVAVAVVIGVVAFAVLRPSDEKEMNIGAAAPEQRSNGGPSESAPKQAVPVLRPGAIRTIEVRRGELVHFVLRSPRADEAHVHGYDILKEVPAGGSVAFRFRARFEGEFEVELENAGKELGHIEVTP